MYISIRRGLVAAAALALAPVTLADSAIAQQAAPAAVSTPSEDERLMALFHDDQQREDALDPLSRVYRGGDADPRVLRQLYTDELTRARRAAVGQSLAAITAIDRRKLSAERQISYDVFLATKREAAMWLQPDMQALVAVRPFTHFGGLHVEFPALIAKGGPLSYADEADYRDNLELLHAFPQVLDNATRQFRLGMDTGVVETKLTTRNMIAQVDALLAQPVEQSPFWSPVVEFPAAVPEDRRALSYAASPLSSLVLTPAGKRAQSGSAAARAAGCAT